jgi:membrane-bound lytic murein transglycosylase D
MKGTAKPYPYLVGIAVAILLAGCNESVKQAVRVYPPAPAPAHAPAERTMLLPTLVRPPVPFLTTEPRPAVDALIEKVQAAYEAGKKDYQAGKIDQARRDFDQAVDLILSSGLSVDADPDLEKLFDDMAETIHTYELETSKQTSAEGEADVVEGSESDESAPIEEIANMNLPSAPMPGLEAKAEQELMSVPHDIPLTLNDSVLSYLSFFQTNKGRLIVETGLRRAGRYREMIRRVLREEGVPLDLIYLAQAESAFQPQAVSRAGARGLWQFMPFRGKEYDLDRNFWIDERSDPEKSTRAAARHLRDLYQMFGDWYLVMAAYNSGPLNVIRAIQRTGYADFWELLRRNSLPKETKNYVPIILALTLVAKQPARYGVQVEPEAAPKVDRVKLGHSIDLRLVSDAIGEDVQTVHMLNPELIRTTTPNDSDFELCVPAGSGDRLFKEIASVPPSKWPSWRLHRVEGGETLATIARQFRVTPASITSVNELNPHGRLDPGTKLVIPARPASTKLVHYRVQRGDTLERIADRFAVTVGELKRWNHLRDNHPPRGARLKIYPGGMAPSRSSDKTSEHASEAKLHPASAQATPLRPRDK